MKIVYTLPDPVYVSGYASHTINPNEFVLLKSLSLYSSSTKLYFRGATYIQDNVTSPDKMFIFHKDGGTIQIQGSYASLSNYKIYKIQLPFNEGHKYYTYTQNSTKTFISLSLDDILTVLPLRSNVICAWINHNISGGDILSPSEPSSIIYDYRGIGHYLSLTYPNDITTIGIGSEVDSTPDSVLAVALKSSFILPPRSLFTSYYDDISYKVHLKRVIYENGSDLYYLNGSLGNSIDVFITEQDTFIPNVFYYIKSIEFDIPDLI